MSGEIAFTPGTTNPSLLSGSIQRLGLVQSRKSYEICPMDIGCLSVGVSWPLPGVLSGNRFSIGDPLWR